MSKSNFSVTEYSAYHLPFYGVIAFIIFNLIAMWIYPGGTYQNSELETYMFTQNYFSDYCYQALFAGCMVEATMYMKDWNTLPVWQNEYQTAIATLRNQARRTRQDDMEVAASPAGGPDTITQGAS